MVGEVVIQKVSGAFMKGFNWWFRFKLLYILIIFLIINSVVIGFQTKSFDSTIKELGERTLNPVYTLYTDSNKIIEQKGAYNSSVGTLYGLFDFFLTWWRLIMGIYLIFAWITIFAFFVGYSPFSNESQKFVNYSLGAVFFFSIIIVYNLLVGNSESVMLPIYAIRDFFKSIPYLVKPFSEVYDTFLPDSTCTNESCI